MPTVVTDKRDFVRAIYEKHQDAVRSTERGRLLFLIVYVLLLGLLLTRHWDGRPIEQYPVLILYGLYSLIGMFVLMKMQVVISSHRAASEYILRRYSLDHYLPVFPVNRYRRFLRLSRLYPTVFLLGFCGVLYRLLVLEGIVFSTAFLLAAIVFLPIFFVLYFSRFDHVILPKDE